MGMLDGKVAVITGAGRGLGKSHAVTMAREGARIVVNDLGVEWDGTGEKAATPADEVVNEIKAAGGDAVANYESVTDFDGARRIVDCAVNTFGKLDIFVNNAGFLKDKITFKMTAEEWDAVVKVHLYGTFNCGRWAISYFRDQNKAGNPIKGRIINTVSHAGLFGNAGQANYSAAKGGIASLTMVWAREMERIGGTCNAIAPMARTRMTMSTEATAAMFAKPEDEGKFDAMAKENISPLVAYLGTDQAQDITGHVFSIRGGRLELFKPWQIANTIDIEKQWTIEEIDHKIRDLGELGMPPIIF